MGGLGAGLKIDRSSLRAGPPERPVGFPRWGSPSREEESQSSAGSRVLDWGRGGGCGGWGVRSQVGSRWGSGRAGKAAGAQKRRV